jgi:hypothetical protein
MKIDGIKILPKIITQPNNLADEFKELFGSDEAKEAKGVVYFFLSGKPIPRVNGESTILYIGKTDLSLNQRYMRYSDKLASNRSGQFYKHIVSNYDGLSLGYLKSHDPKALEREYFKKYCDTYLEFPPKSKVG